MTEPLAKRLLFMIFKPSSKSFTRLTHSTGPKISSRPQDISSVT
jgi:hypothetical protein